MSQEKANPQTPLPPGYMTSPGSHIALLISMMGHLPHGVVGSLRTTLVLSLGSLSTHIERY